MAFLMVSSPPADALPAPQTTKTWFFNSDGGNPRTWKIMINHIMSSSYSFWNKDLRRWFVFWNNTYLKSSVNSSKGGSSRTLNIIIEHQVLTPVEIKNYSTFIFFICRLYISSKLLESSSKWYSNTCSVWVDLQHISIGNLRAESMLLASVDWSQPWTRLWLRNSHHLKIGHMRWLNSYNRLIAYQTFLNAVGCLNLE